MSEMPTSPPTTGDGPSGPRAGFGQRLGALLIDVVILFVAQGIIWALFNENVAGGVGTLLSLAYYTYFEGTSSGQTVGKRALGIRVIDFRTGGPIGHGRAFIRWISRILSTIPLPARLLLDALGPREADLARQAGDHGGRAHERLPGRQVARLAAR